MKDTHDDKDSKHAWRQNVRVEAGIEGDEGHQTARVHENAQRNGRPPGGRIKLGWEEKKKSA